MLSATHSIRINNCFSRNAEMKTHMKTRIVKGEATLFGDIDPPIQKICLFKQCLQNVTRQYNKAKIYPAHGFRFHLM